MVYGDFKDLTRRTDSDKVLRDKGFNIAKNSKYDRYQRDLAALFMIFLIKSLLLHTKENEEILRANNKLKHYTSQLLENLKKEKYTHVLKTMFGVLILRKCN